MKTAAAAVLLVAAAAPALGNIYPTEPVGTTTWQAGSQETVRWQDDGQTPALATLGSIDIQLYTGGQTQQTFLQTLATADANTGTARVRIPADLGPNGQYYFLRFRASGSTDLTADVYSTRFTMERMTGEFNSTVQAQISGLPASATGSASVSASRSASITSSVSRSASSSVSASRSAATPSQTGAAVVSYGMASGAVVAAAFGLIALFA